MNEQLETTDFCEYNPYGFKEGDIVITSDGSEGVIKYICTCRSCEERGFYEPCVKLKNGETLFVTIYDKKGNFRSFYKIGDLVLGNIDIETAQTRIARAQKALEEAKAELEDAEKSLATVQRLLKGGDSNA